MAYSQDIRDRVFSRLGVYVKWWRALGEMSATVEAEAESAAERFGIAASVAPAPADLAAFEAVNSQSRRQQETIASLRASVAGLASEFLARNVREMLPSTAATADGVLDDLLDGMDDGGDTVARNNVAVENVAEDAGNSVRVCDGVALPVFGAPAQLARNDSFRLACVDDRSVGAERWSLVSGLLGTFPGDVVTGVQAGWPAAGLVGPTVEPAPVHGYTGFFGYGLDGFADWRLDGVRAGVNTNDGQKIFVRRTGATEYAVTLYNSDLCRPQDEVAAGSGSGTAWPRTVTLSERNASGLNGSVSLLNADETELGLLVVKLYNWRVSGASRGENVSADGRVWLRFGGDPATGGEGDELHQLASWQWSSVSFGVDTDDQGRMHASVVKEPDGFRVYGGVVADLDAGSVVIDGATSGNTLDGTLYATVTREDGSPSGQRYTIDLFKSPSRGTSDHVATGSVDHVVESDFPLAVPLSAVGGGVSGSITLTAYRSNLNGSDTTAQVRVPRYFVRVYRSAARGAEDLVGEGTSYEPSGSTVSFFTRGGSVDVDLNYVQDDNDIVVRPPLYTMEAWRVDPNAPGASASDVVARGGRAVDPKTTPLTDFQLLPANDSGLSITVDVNWDPCAEGTALGATVGYAAGDSFTFSTSTDDAGRLQTFLREAFGRAFPAATATIPDPGDA